MHLEDILPGLLALDQPRGPAARTLRIGDTHLAIEGLDPELASVLDVRYGGFLVPEPAGAGAIVLRVWRGGSTGWLPRYRPGERYRVEAKQAATARIVHSYHFALWRTEPAGAWSCAVAEQEHEPLDRVLENAVRCLLARLAVEDGGFALHAAGVLSDGRAFLLSGPSRAGKTTAVSFSGPRRSLGDDFAIVLPRGGTWCAPAVPFDNTERAPADPPQGLFEVAGIWRLFQAPEPRVETPVMSRAIASLLACAALPWTYPDLADRLLEQLRRFAAESRFEHLHFRPAPDFWPLIERAS